MNSERIRTIMFYSIPGLIAANFIMMFLTATDPNKVLLYEDDGTAANCRAIIHKHIEDWTKEISTPEEALQKIKKSCGAHGTVW